MTTVLRARLRRILPEMLLIATALAAACVETPGLADEKVSPAESSSPGKSNRDSKQTLLLVDDYHVLYRAGTRRVFHPAVLNPSNPVIREDQPWEMAIGWTSVVRHPEFPGSEWVSHST